MGVACVEIPGGKNERLVMRFPKSVILLTTKFEKFLFTMENLAFQSAAGFLKRDRQTTAIEVRRKASDHP